LRELRILIVSPLAPHQPGKKFFGETFRNVVTVRRSDEVETTLSRPRQRFDVVLVDLMWNDFELEWTYDGMDVLAAMNARGRHEDVALACQGHGFERPYLEEGRGHPDVKGLILKSSGPGVLDGIRAVASGQIYVDRVLGDALHPPGAAIADYFAGTPRLARIAGVIASGAAGNWKAVSEALSVSIDNVNVASDLFRPMLATRSELPFGDHEPTQATIYRWCGENAHYILSWCRRNAQTIGMKAETFQRRSHPRPRRVRGRPPALK